MSDAEAMRARRFAPVRQPRLSPRGSLESICGGGRVLTLGGALVSDAEVMRAQHFEPERGPRLSPEALP